MTAQVNGFPDPAIRRVRSMTADIRYGRTDIELDARFLDALLGAADSSIDVADDFFRALEEDDNSVSTVNLEPIIISQNLSDDLAIYERLGRALGCLGSRLSKVRIVLLDNDGVMAAAAAVMKHVRQVHTLVWNIGDRHEDSFDPTHRESASLRDALKGNLSIEQAFVGYYQHSKGVLEAVCDSLPRLGALRQLHLMGDETNQAASLTMDQARRLQEVIKMQSLRTLILEQVCFHEADAAELIGQAIAESGLTTLKVTNGRHYVRDTIVDIPGALKCRHLRVLELFNTGFSESDAAMSFCQALAASPIELIRLYNFGVNTEAIEACGQAICRPCLTELDIDGSSSGLLESIAFYSENASSLRVLNVDFRGVSGQSIEVEVVELLCCCTSIRKLSIRSIHSWTPLHDQASAALLVNFRTLVHLHIELNTFIDIASRNDIESPHFLAAIQQHRVVEAVVLQGTSWQRWSQTLLQEVGRLASRNKETRIFRGRLDSLYSDSTCPALVSPLLHRVQSRPHLLYLTLTTYKQYLAEFVTA